jgi:hypothetical protein
MKKITKILIFSLFGIMLFSDCGTNVFQAPDSLLETTADGLIILGNRAKRDQNYTKALDYYVRASEEDPNLTDAWYLQAEMILLTAEGGQIRLPDLISELISENNRKLPFFPSSDMPNAVLRQMDIPNPSGGNIRIDYMKYDSLYDRLVNLYNPTMKAYEALLRIYGDGTSAYKVANKGQFTREIIRMDFTMLSALRTALISLDQKPQDGRLEKELGPWNAERKLYMLMAGGLKDINNININVDSVKQLFDGPDDINGMIENLVAAAEISLNAITDTKLELEGANIDSAKKAMMNDPQKQMQTIIAKAGYFYYTDYKDNDLSFFKTPGSHPSYKQRMIWIDINDNDQIDWVNPNDSSINISEVISDIRRNKVAYDTNYFQVNISGADTFFIFKGTHGGEFVAGDWSIDEEQLDDKDNDGDGLKDEDSRMSSDTLDQDFDFIKIDNRQILIDFKPIQSGKFAYDSTTSEIKNTSRMLWDDLNGDGRINGPAPDFDVIDRAYVIENKAAIEIAINNGTGYGEWISGDWGIDEEYYDGIDNDGDGRIDEDGDIHRIHNWTQPQKEAFIQNIKNVLSANPTNIRARE